MKRVRLITTDEHNGKEAISRTPLRNKYFFEGAWHEVKLKWDTEVIIFQGEPTEVVNQIKPVILRDAQIIEATEVIFAEMPETFDIRALTNQIDIEMYDCNKRPREATIDRQLRQLRQYGKLNYEVVDDQKGLYRKLAVNERICAEQKKIDFQPDWKKRFMEFLKEEGAYEKFMKNKETMPVFIKGDCVLKNKIRSPFSWAESPEGFEYWGILDEKWGAICDGKN